VHRKEKDHKGAGTQAFVSFVSQHKTPSGEVAVSLDRNSCVQSVAYFAYFALPRVACLQFAARGHACDHKDFLEH